MSCFDDTLVQIFLYGRAKLINLMKNNEAQFEHKKVQFPGCKRLVIKSDESTVCLFYVWVFLKIEQFWVIALGHYMQFEIVTLSHLTAGEMSEMGKTDPGLPWR